MQRLFPCLALLVLLAGCATEPAPWPSAPPPAVILLPNPPHAMAPPPPSAMQSAPRPNRSSMMTTAPAPLPSGSWSPQNARVQGPPARSSPTTYRPVAAGPATPSAPPLAPLQPTAAPPPLAGAESLSGRSILSLQVFLDRHGFSPNCLDGLIGTRTHEALLAYETAHGLQPSTRMDAALIATLGMPTNAFTTYVVAEEDLAALTPVPATWLGKSQAQRLGYQTVLELVAERFHASETAIRNLNPGVMWPNPQAGTALLVPNPYPAPAVPAARLRILLSRKLVQALDAQGGLLAQFPCSIGRDREKRPVGELKVATCAADPSFVLDPAVFQEDPEVRALGRKLVIPPGPNNPVGVAWIGLDRPGFGIHGTPRPEDIGKTESHGCFRLANWNAQRLLRMISIGMPVTVDP